MPSCFGRSLRAARPARRRCSCSSAGSRSRRTSTLSSTSICRARRSSSATGRRAAALQRAISDKSAFSARGRESALRGVYASADVFVFPSLTDTFGIVLLEALACGLPVAAFPVMGPLDVIGAVGCGCLDPDLRPCAWRHYMRRDKCRAYGFGFTWRESVRQFLDNTRRAHGVLAGAARPLLANTRWRHPWV